MFLQIHTLTSYHASLLNRDDDGLAKRIPFGDAQRTRISSQCQKRHWRQDMSQNIALPKGFRSRHFFSRVVFPRLVESGVDEKQAHDLTKQLIAKVISKKATAEDEEGDSGLSLKQPVLFGEPEADYFFKLLTNCAGNGEDPAKTLDEQLKAQRGNFRAMLAAAGGDDLIAGIEGAMFGRFVTSDILARSDAAVHVAHAFTVHPLDNEVDYFTTVDDLDNKGASHVGDMELGAGLFYGYVVVDVPLLVSNLCGCKREGWQDATDGKADARRVLGSLLQSIATVTPGAKLGSTAPYARTDFMLLETGQAQPRALSNAYLQALRPSGNVMQNAVDMIGDYLAKLDGMYGVEGERLAASTQDLKSVPSAEQGTLADVTDRALGQILGAV